MTSKRPICLVCGAEPSNDLTKRRGPWRGVCSSACHQAAELEITRINDRLASTELKAIEIRELIAAAVDFPDEFGRTLEQQLDVLERRIEADKVHQRELLHASGIPGSA